MIETAKYAKYTKRNFLFRVFIWVPRSVTPYIRKEPVSPKMNCLGRACEVTIEDWWWDKNGRGVTKDGQLEMTMEMENER